MGSLRVGARPVPTLLIPGCAALGESLPSLGPRRNGTASEVANSVLQGLMKPRRSGK